MTFLTHWGRVTHICVGNLTIIGSDNGMSPGRRQAIIGTKAGILLIGPWGTNFSEILIVILTFSFKKIHLKMSSAKWRPFCLGLNVLSMHSNVYLVLQLFTPWVVSALGLSSDYRITWWRHQMETFSALLALCAGNSPVPVNSPHKGQWRRALMFYLIYDWRNSWVNNREAGDLRRHPAHYHVIVM